MDVTKMNNFNCKLLKIPKMFMLYSGCWRFPFTKYELVHNLYNKCYSVLCQGSCLVLMVSMVARLPYLASRDTRKFVETVGYITILSLIATKLFICRSSAVGDLVSRIIYEEKALYIKGSPEITENYNSYVKLSKKVHITLLVAIYSVWVCCFLKHFILYVICYSPAELITTGNTTVEYTSERLLPLEMWMPFDQSIHYGKAFLIMASFIFAQTTFNSVSQLLFISLMMYVIAELKNLQIIAKSFDFGVSENDLEAESLVILKKLVMRHQKIIKFVDDLNNAVGGVMLQEYLLNSLSLANLMYQIPKSLEHPILFTIFYVDFLIVLIIELIFLSWYANEIKLESINLSDALFESNWYNHSKKVKRHILLMMIRSQKPLLIWIGPFLPMSISVAITSMKASYSYVTMMSRFSDNK